MAWRKCPICNKSYFNLWNHFWKDHPDSKLSELEFLCKYLGLDEVPKCKTCGKPVSFSYSHYSISVTCGSPACKSDGFKLNLDKPITCSKCNREFRNVQAYHAHKCFKLVKNKQGKSIYQNQFTKWRLSQPPEVLSDIARRAAQTRNKNGNSFGYYVNRKMSPERKHELAVQRGLASVKSRKFDGKNYYSSKVEIALYRRIKSLFPNYTVYGYDSDFQVLIYKPDIYIKELNLIIEVDGVQFHDIRKDIRRDKLICKKLNCKIRRLDADYVKSYLSDAELLCSIIIELSQTSNYYDRIPIEDILYWKWNPHITGPRLLLSYDHHPII